MDVEDRKAEVLVNLRKHLARLSEIEKSISEDAVNANLRLRRWRERVIQYLRFNVSETEAEFFAIVKAEESYSDLSIQLRSQEIPAFSKALENVIEEVEDNPHLLSPKSPLTTSPAPITSESGHQPPGIGAPATAVENDDKAVVGTARDTRNVFVVHGRNLEARNSLFRFLRSIGLRPLEWSQAIQETGKASPFIGEILDVAFYIAQAIVVLMTPDDVAQLQEPFRSPSDPPYESQLTGQARPNVLFEAGMAMGRNPDRTIIVELGTVRPFSDIAGRHTVRLRNVAQSRQELAERLRTAGCPVDLSGSHWYEEGDFDIHEINAVVTDSPHQTSGGIHPDEVEKLIRNSETFKLPIETVMLTTGTVYGTAGGEYVTEALQRLGYIQVSYSTTDQGKSITTTLTKRGKAQSEHWEYRDSRSEYNNTLEDWIIPTANIELGGIDRLIQEDPQTAFVKFTFKIVPNNLGVLISDIRGGADNAKYQRIYSARIVIHRLGGKWVLSEKELQTNLSLASISTS